MSAQLSEIRPQSCALKNVSVFGVAPEEIADTDGGQYLCPNRNLLKAIINVQA